MDRLPIVYTLQLIVTTVTLLADVLAAAIGVSTSHVPGKLDVAHRVLLADLKAGHQRIGPIMQTHSAKLLTMSHIGSSSWSSGSSWSASLLVASSSGSADSP